MPAAASGSFAVLLAIGPDEQEVARTADLLESIVAYEREPFSFVMVDDADARDARDLLRAIEFPARCTPASIPHPRRQFPERAAAAKKGKGICAAMQQGLRWIAQNAGDI